MIQSFFYLSIKSSINLLIYLTISLSIYRFIYLFISSSTQIPLKATLYAANTNTNDTVTEGPKDEDNASQEEDSTAAVSEPSDEVTEP